MTYDTKVIPKSEFAWVTVRFRLLYEEGWEITPDSLKTAKNENVIYLRRPMETNNE